MNADNMAPWVMVAPPPDAAASWTTPTSSMSGAGDVKGDGADNDDIFQCRRQQPKKPWQQQNWSPGVPSGGETHGDGSGDMESPAAVSTVATTVQMWRRMWSPEAPTMQ